MIVQKLTWVGYALHGNFKHMDIQLRTCDFMISVTTFTHNFTEYFWVILFIKLRTAAVTPQLTKPPVRQRYGPRDLVLASINVSNNRMPLPTDLMAAV